MPNHETRLLIVADLNRGSSIGEINKSIRAIQKSPYLRKIKLQVEVDPRILNTLQQFNANLGRVNQTIGQQLNLNKKVAQSNMNVAQSFNAVAQSSSKSSQSMQRDVENLISGNKKNIQAVDVLSAKIRQRTDETGREIRDVALKTGNAFESTVYTGRKVDNGELRTDNATTTFMSPEKLKEAQTALNNFTTQAHNRISNLTRAWGENSQQITKLRNEVLSLDEISNTPANRQRVSDLIKQREDELKLFDKAHADNERFDKNRLESQKKLDAFTAKSNKRFTEMRKVIGTLNPEIKKLSAELKTFDINSSNQDYQNLNDKIKNLEKYTNGVRKSRETEKKIEQGYIKDIDRAHFEAFQEKERREKHLGSQRIQDQKLARQMALAEDNKFNQQRFINEQKFNRMRLDAENKIEIARMKFGHHRGINAELDGALYNLQQLTPKTKDWENSIRNVNSQVVKTTTGLKAMRNETIGFVDGFKTAINLTVAYIRNYIDSQSVNL